jgi:hypothetical protein
MLAIFLQRPQPLQMSKWLWERFDLCHTCYCRHHLSTANAFFSIKKEKKMALYSYFRGSGNTQKHNQTQRQSIPQRKTKVYPNISRFSPFRNGFPLSSRFVQTLLELPLPRK